MRARWPIAACCALFALAFALRCVQLGQESFWTDEGVTLSALRIGIFPHVREIETSPPLYFILIKPWAMLFGQSHVALRLAAVLYGALAVPALYLCARRWGLARGWGLALMAWACIHPLLIFQSQQARYYSLLLLLGILWLATLPPLLRGGARKRDGAAFVVAGFLAFCAHYTFALFPFASAAAVIAAWAMRRIERATALRLLALHVALGAVCCLLLPLMLYQLSKGHTAYLPVPVWSDLSDVYLRMNAFGAETQGWRWVPWAGGALLLLAAAGWLRAAWTCGKSSDAREAEANGSVASPSVGTAPTLPCPALLPLLLALAFLPNMLAFAISLGLKPVFYAPRYSTVYIPAFMLATAWGWGRLPRAARNAAFALLFAALAPVSATALHGYWTQLQLFDWIGTIRTVEGEWRNGDVAVFHPGWLAADYMNNGGQVLAGLAAEDLPALEQAPRVWLVMWEDTPERETADALKTLREQRHATRRIDGAGITLSLIE